MYRRVVLFQVRRNGLAGAAPGGEAVDDDLGVFLDGSVKVLDTARWILSAFS